MIRVRWVVAAGVALAATAPLPAQTAMPWDPAVPGTLSWVAGRESVRMVACILRGGPMGVGQGWFAPGQSVYGWKWLAARYDADHDGVITRAEFTGPATVFDRLDRDGDGRLTPADFDFSDGSPAARQAGFADGLFRRADANSDGYLHGYTNSDCDIDAYADSERYSYTNTHPHGHGYSNANSYCYSNGDGNTYSYGDAHAGNWVCFHTGLLETPCGMASEPIAAGQPQL